MKQTNKTADAIDLLALERALLPKTWLIALVAIVFGIASFLGTKILVRPTYRAEALMYVNSSNISVGSTKVSISQAELTAAQTLVETYIVIMNTRTTLEEVIEQTGVPYSYEQLKRMITAKSVSGTEVFSIQVVSTSPTEAETLANAIARILPEKIAAIVEGSSARIVDYAVVPARKDGPSLSKNAVMGAFHGAALVVGLLVMQFLQDDKIHGSDYLVQNYQIPVLAVVPDLLLRGSGDYYYAGGDSRKQKGR